MSKAISQEIRSNGIVDSDENTCLDVPVEVGVLFDL
jgi:hypothetical protein